MFWKKKAKRELFRYHNGKSLVYADPLKTWSKIWDDPETDLETEVQLLESDAVDDKAQAAAFNDVVSLSKRVFGLHELNAATGAGMTQKEMIDVLSRFITYMTDIKKKHSQ